MSKAFVDKDGKIFMAFDRFDFETQIMSCWGITTDLKDLSEEVLEGDLSKDQITNVLIGIEQLYNIRFEKLFRQFEQLIREHAKSFDQMSDEELKDMIEKDLTDRAKKHEKENPIPHDAGWWADDKDD